MNNSINSETVSEYLIGLCEIIEKAKEDEKNDFVPTEPLNLKQLSPRSLFSKVRKSICDLVNFKQMVSEADLFDVVSEIEKLENCLQLREADVRKHIQKEYQLRVILQDRKWDLDKLEIHEKGLKSSLNQLESRAHFVKIPKFLDENKVKQDMNRKIEDLAKSIVAKDERIQNVIKENEEIKRKIEEREVELKILKKEKKRIENLAHLMKRSPSSVSTEEMQPGPECVVFLSPILEQDEKKKLQLQPRHKRNRTAPELDLSRLNDSIFSPQSVFVKVEVPKLGTKTYKRSLFHDRTYNKIEVN